ncbi:MAG: fluoride efflux transporter CrcB [Rhodobacterales bacterium]|nr:fluoride efflux transporter CrcB [Rhodobacterales bacterium]
MFINLINVALGGAIGAALRYLVGIGVVRAIGIGGLWGMPVGVILVNIVGSFLMGVFVVAAAQRGLTHLSPFVMTGVLGGFTTFSAFSLETVTLFERGQIGTAAAYVVLSVALSLGGLVIGLMVARGYWA